MAENLAEPNKSAELMSVPSREIDHVSRKHSLLQVALRQKVLSDLLEEVKVETACVNSIGAIVEREIITVRFFRENLENGSSLDMIHVPEGYFKMGSPEDEKGRFNAEDYLHPVKVPPFFLGRYPVTQTQWTAVAKTLDKIKLDLNVYPSYFNGDQLPVERVSWFEAMEFCARLAKYTKRPYRLPSEAEWEYACRAKTQTPFYFGETITTDIANYRGTNDELFGWSGSYAQGPQGIFRDRTTPVDWFGVANSFGLCDMHGNVYEWCLDPVHYNYAGSPDDGSAWLSESESESQKHIVRGGAWESFPWFCRSAYRSYYNPSDRHRFIGFRLAASEFFE